MKKKILLAIAGLLCIALLFYRLFPARHTISGSMVVKTPLPFAERNLADTMQWKHWWPWKNDKGAATPEGRMIVSRGIADILLNLQWIEQDDTIPATIVLAPRGNDSTLMAWAATIRSGSSPWERILQFSRAKRMANDLKTFATAWGVYASNPKSAYGFEPVFTMVKDTLLVTTRASLQPQAETEVLYGCIQKLRAYAEKHGARITGEPMYQYMTAQDSGEIMVALPISREVPNSAGIMFKRMVDGHLLTAEVKGGPMQLKAHFMQFENYKNDHQLASPAIPYMQPLTNRMQQKDTSGWKTRLCYPIF